MSLNTAHDPDRSAALPPLILLPRFAFAAGGRCPVQLPAHLCDERARTHIDARTMEIHQTTAITRPM